jgi:hypothetical protein
MRPNLDRARGLFDSAVAPWLQEGKVPVWSWESLALSQPALRLVRAQNLRAVFGPCKLVITLRQPVRLVESVYFQHLKRENVGGKYRRFRRPWVHSIDSWLEEGWGSFRAPGAHLDYANTVEIFARVFGRENVGVFLFEDLVADPEAFVRRLCGFIGVEADVGVALTQQARRNDRWRAEHLSALEDIGASRRKRWAFRLQDKPGRLRMLGLDGPLGSAQGQPARVHLSGYWRARIAERTAPGNAALSRDWDLPLHLHGYPLPPEGESIAAGNCL